MPIGLPQQPNPGGWRQGDSIADRDNQLNVLPGTAYWLNSKLTSISTIAATNPGSITSVGQKVYVFNSNYVSIINANTDLITKTVNLPGTCVSTRYIGKDDNRIYFVWYDGGGNCTLVYLDIALETLSGTSIGVGVNTSTGIIYKNRLYIGAQTSGLVYIIRVDTFAFVSTKVVPAALTFAVDSDRDKVYCFSFTDTVIRIIDYNTDNFTGVTIAVASGTTSSAGRSNGDQWVYFNNKIVALSRNTGQALIINTITDTIDAAITVGTTPVNALLYLCKVIVANYGSGTISIFDISDTIITVEKTITVGPFPCAGGAMEVLDDKLLVPIFGNSNVDGSINMIDMSLLISESVKLTGSQVRSICIVPGLNKIYNSSQNNNNIKSFLYQFYRLFVYGSNRTGWIDITPVKRAGDFIDNVLQYSQDFSDCFNDSSIPSVLFVKALVATGALSKESIINFQKAKEIFSVASGTNAYTAAFSPVLPVLTEGTRVYVEFTNANTAASTFAPDAVTALPIKKADGSALASGDIPAGAVLELSYHTTYWQIIGGAGSSLVFASQAEVNAGTVSAKPIAPNTNKIFVNNTAFVNALIFG
jgi:hypothetical protein